MFPRPPPALYAEQQTHKATLAPPPHPHALFSNPFFCTAMLNQRAEQTWGARSSPALFNVCNYANLWRRLSVETKDESVSIPGEPTAPQPAQQKSSLTCQIGLLSAGGFLLAASTPERNWGDRPAAKPMWGGQAGGQEAEPPRTSVDCPSKGKALDCRKWNSDWDEDNRHQPGVEWSRSTMRTICR